MNDNLKTKLSFAEQVNKLESKGVSFEIFKKNDAETFLSKNTYYFKLKAYLSNYQKNPTTGLYKNVDFAHLVELSTIDFHLRRIILSISVNIEHILKSELLYCVTTNSKECGVSIAKEFLKKHKYVHQEIEKGKKNSMTGNLIEYRKGEYAIWHLLELVSFKTFIDIYDFYHLYHKKSNRFKGRLMPVRILRNASAHNNCLIINLSKKEMVPKSDVVSGTSTSKRKNANVITGLKNINGISKKSLTNQMSKRIIHDITVMFTVINDLKEHPSIKHGCDELKEFFGKRMPRNKEYFLQNTDLFSGYSFLKKIVDFYF